MGESEKKKKDLIAHHNAGKKKEGLYNHDKSADIVRQKGVSVVVAVKGKKNNASPDKRKRDKTNNRREVQERRIKMGGKGKRMRIWIRNTPRKKPIGRYTMRSIPSGPQKKQKTGIL